jgi:two-component system nitrate/nitrite sensor histidine kinase NarX
VCEKHPIALRVLGEEWIMLTSLWERMGLLFLAFFLLVSISVAASFYTIETQKKDALVINLAGRQRMLIQQMSKDALQIEKEGAKAHALALQEAARTFDQTLWALRHGGQAPYLPDRAVDVPPTRSPDILARLDELDDAWDTFSAHLDVIMAGDLNSPEFIPSVEAVERLSPGLIQGADDVVRLYETASAHKVARLRWIQGAFFASVLVLLAIDSLLVRKFVGRPLSALGSTAERIGRGDLDTPVEVSGPREIQHLAHNFDTMRAQLKTSNQELIAWTEELEARVDQRTRELAALYEVSREVSSRLDIEHVLRSVTDKAQELLGGEVAALCLLEEESGLALHLGALSGPQEALSRARVSAQRSPATEVLAGDGALPCGVEDCAGSCGILTAPFRVSHLAAPLRVGERVTGALCVGSPRAGHFSDEAAMLLTELANSAAIALENARLYEQAERVATLEERQRIAAEMHDGLAQTLNYLGLKTGQAAGFVEAGRGEEAMDELGRIRAAIVQASQEVRQSIASLQEGPRPRQALRDRLAETVDEFARDGGPPIDLVVRFQPPLLLPPDEAEQVLRVAREALLNARRHAQAERISVYLEQGEGVATVTVEDDGAGFDPKAPAANGGTHFGLRIMRARAARIGGQLAVHSMPDRGTRVVLTWPIGDGRRMTDDEGRMILPD